MDGKLLVDYIMYGILDGDAEVTNRTEGEIKSGEVQTDKSLPQEYYDIISQRVTEFISQMESSLKDDIQAAKDYVSEMEEIDKKKDELQTLIKKLVAWMNKWNRS